MNKLETMASPFILARESGGFFHRVKGLHLQDHRISVPLDYSKTTTTSIGDHGIIPDNSRSTSITISIYAREVRKASDVPVSTSRASEAETVVASSKETKEDKKSYLLYLQGGPGYRAGRPTGPGGWISAALDAGFRVILLDQRGTGQSTRASIGLLKRMKDKKGEDAVADYLANFRADSIVRDAERLRLHLGIEKWTLLGQSFGGFCSVQYLSMYPESLREVLITGGLPPCVALPCAAETVYQKLFERVKVQNAKYYQRFPQDVDAVREIAIYLHCCTFQENYKKERVQMPKGGILTMQGFQALGILFGLQDGFELVHYLIEDAWDADGGPHTSPLLEEWHLSHEFLAGVEKIISLDEAPLYLLLHESIYCSGGVSNWACERVRSSDRLVKLFDADYAIDMRHGGSTRQPVLFTGEMMFPWMAKTLGGGLECLDGVANKLAKRKWPKLYDVEKLKRVDVPVAAATYVEDMFVDFDLARETAKLIGAEAGAPMLLGASTSSSATSNGSPAAKKQKKGDEFEDRQRKTNFKKPKQLGGEHVRQLMTSAYNHSGLREDGATIFKELLAMVRDEHPVR
ncbi:unnamed protein product [Amoebophrya sp. A25]|nr:unnamed protein product [Amoebophrya sp. A25]|eukprot:GSA25T00018458001.1